MDGSGTAFDLGTTLGDDLHEQLRVAADKGPLLDDPQTGGVLVLRHADIESLARDHRLRGVGLTMFDLMGIGDGALRRWYGGLMFTNEGEPHNRLRALVSRAFTPRAVERLRADTHEFAAAAIAPLVRDGGGDVVAALALLPMRVMCRLLGVPDRDVTTFAAWGDTLSRVFGLMDASEIAAAETAITELLDYIDALVAERRTTPADDLVTALLAAEDEGDRLTHAELIDMVANLLVGGHDTTASQLGCTFLTLVRHPDEAERVATDRSLLHSAVAESIRFEPSISAVPRTSFEPVEIAGRELDAGSLLFLCTAAGNREIGVWESPDRFDAARFTAADAPRLLSFGAGPHYCLGAALARMTIEEAVGAACDAGGVRAAGDPWDVEWRQVLGRSPSAVEVTVG